MLSGLGSVPSSGRPACEITCETSGNWRRVLRTCAEIRAASLSDTLDARFAESPGPKGSLAELLLNRGALDAAAPARAEHDRRTLAIYFERFRTEGLALFDEAVEAWWVGNPNMRSLVEKPMSTADLRQVQELFRRLAQNLREKETDRAMEARGFVKQYVAVSGND